MGVNREEYIVIGMKFDDKFTDRLWARPDQRAMDEKYSWEKEREKEIQYLSDWMSGDYTFFGYIQQISDGDDENTTVTEINEPQGSMITAIQKKFIELFPDEEMVEIKIYHVLHYT